MSENNSLFFSISLFFAFFFQKLRLSRFQENDDYTYLNELALKSPDSFEEYFNTQINSQIKESISKDYLQCACFVKSIKDCLTKDKID